MKNFNINNYQIASANKQHKIFKAALTNKKITEYFKNKNDCFSKFSSSDCTFENKSVKNTFSVTSKKHKLNSLKRQVMSETNSINYENDIKNYFVNNLDDNFSFGERSTNSVFTFGERSIKSEFTFAKGSICSHYTFG